MVLTNITGSFCATSVNYPSVITLKKSLTNDNEVLQADETQFKDPC